MFGLRCSGGVPSRAAAGRRDKSQVGLVMGAWKFQEMVRELFALSGGGQPSLEQMAEVAMKHGQEFVGQPLE